jgi:uncharacterized protein YjlB
MKAKINKPTMYRYSDDGSVPNNPTLPMLFYRSAINLAGTVSPEERVEDLFRDNGWVGLWRNGIYPYTHYHSMIHEALGIARGRARVRFGGTQGDEIDMMPGNVVVLPAGTGHQCLWQSPDLSVIGAYPPSGKYDLCRGSKYEREQALLTIPKVPLPETDPVGGASGPLLRLWHARAA